MKVFLQPIRVEIQADTAYIVHSGGSKLSDNMDLDSLLTQFPVDTLYGEAAHKIFILNPGTVSYVWVIVAVVIITLLAVLIVMALRTLKKQDRQCREMMTEMQQLVQSNRSTCEAIAVLIEERVRLMQSLVSQYKEADKLPHKNMHLMDQVEYLKETNNNYRKVLDAFKDDTRFLSQLEMALNAGKSDIMSRVRGIFGDQISENDYHILAALFAGMSPSVISFMTGVREGTIRVKKSRFIDRFETLGNADEKRLFLDALQVH